MVEVSRTVDEVGERASIDVKCGHAFFDCSVEVAAPGVDDAEVYARVGYTG
ncbi:hypothetical protein [Nonomuraea phyllanthi]|uniref:hypothetical protein n=1 Tax=Nonomuraea phyllanthi TaxID=2219224 RepID=UPI0012932FB3|nr:hypothetical protein [Nonomuraea phyllanthi]